MNNRIIASLYVLCAILSALPRASAQGLLTPPGAPAPTMKTLSQIEPRTPITNLPYTITSPGSYYVTTNLTCTICTSGQNGISFMFIPLAENVTIDLNGFTLVGVSGSGNGIDAFAGTNIVIRNGTLANWGADGVNMSGTYNSRFENLQLNGNAHIGLEAGVGSVVVNCEAMGNTVAGISLLTGNISHCVAVGNGTGIVTSAGCVVADCTVSGNSSDGINGGIGTVVRSCSVYQNHGNGVTAANNCTVNDCTVSTNLINGIVTGNKCTVKDCTVTGSAGDGIDVGNNCTVKDCNASANGSGGIGVSNNSTVIGCIANGNGGGGGSDAGIFVGFDVHNCTVKDCTASGNSMNGITVSATDCLITGNSCSGNGQYGIYLYFGLTRPSRNRVDGNNVGNNGSFGINVDSLSLNMTNSITRNSSPGPGYGGFTGNNDYAPTGAVNTATNPWTNF